MTNDEKFSTKILMTDGTELVVKIGDIPFNKTIGQTNIALKWGYITKEFTAEDDKAKDRLPEERAIVNAANDRLMGEAGWMVKSILMAAATF